jgi:D-alanine-D-alanine ligase
MKIAVVYNMVSKNVVNLFGLPNQEIIGKKTIRRISEALKKGGHQVTTLEGDKDLVDRLEQFMPRVIKGERPGMVFNVSYGIQGQARYTHVPSILEMVGVPYVASGPLAHSLSLDKVVTKMILRQNGLPTPEFAVLDSPDSPAPDLPYPLIVKPKSEAVSFGITVVNDAAELRDAVGAIFQRFRQPVLVEQYVEGREINVGLLGNNPPDALPPVELVFPEDGPRIYTFEDKTRKGGRTISHSCPAPIGDELLKRAQEIAVKAFNALGCYDCARVDMRLDANDNLYILETNSLPSLGEHGSFLVGAAQVGLDFDGVVNRLVEVASARYFGTPQPPTLEDEPSDPGTQIFSFITQRRDDLERRVKEWTQLSSHTIDPIGIQEAVRRAERLFRDLRMQPVDDLTDQRSAWTWQTARGLSGGTLFVGHLDVPVSEQVPSQRFRREPEWLYGDGVGSSRAPLVILEFALRAQRACRLLRKQKLGVLLYTDEGRDARYSQGVIRSAMEKAARCFVLRPGGIGESVTVQRRGQRKYRFRIEADPLRPGKASKKPEPLRWVWQQLERFAALSDRKKRVSVSAVDVRTEALPMLLPHRVTVQLMVTFPNDEVADRIEQQMRALVGKSGPRWELERIIHRPAMTERRSTVVMAKTLEKVAEKWEIPVKRESSVWPSVAGLAPPKTPVLCGIGPVARELGTPHEAVQRISLVQRTLLLAETLARLLES